MGVRVPDRMTIVAGIGQQSLRLGHDVTRSTWL